jgi:hypothetical protein
MIIEAASGLKLLNRLGGMPFLLSFYSQIESAFPL